ncbi:hypothetical protein MNBD_GAMMA05-532 [hydrothermal vent metagenome]|uniref:Uncharacterized protein n=1 Tax=hydrothermal vent metagenome TaxID=652676 RepID=A0A3B0WU90_9ZZZZ
MDGLIKRYYERPLYARTLLIKKFLRRQPCGELVRWVRNVECLYMRILNFSLGQLLGQTKETKGQYWSSC